MTIFLERSVGKWPKHLSTIIDYKTFGNISRLSFSGFLVFYTFNNYTISSFKDNPPLSPDDDILTSVVDCNPATRQAGVKDLNSFDCAISD